MVIDFRKLVSCGAVLASFAACSSSDAPVGPGAGAAGKGGRGGAGGSGGTAGRAPEAGPDAAETGSPGDGATVDVLDETSDAITDTGTDAMSPPAPPTLSATGFFKSIGADGGIV